MINLQKALDVVRNMKPGANILREIREIERQASFWSEETVKCIIASKKAHQRGDFIEAELRWQQYETAKGRYQMEVTDKINTFFEL